ncbi:MAG: type II secretion system F family protein [Acidimicrobiia bacterium]|nr:type II secretion system F family protein [Acidimicrobiia bacterium]NNC74029.1 type II secretion system F family protein [Acidimicrobiia bacterium]
MSIFAASPVFPAIVVFVTVAAGVVYIGTGVLSARASASRRLVSLQSRSEQLEAGFAERALAPIVEGLGGVVLRFTPQGWAARARQRIVYAGWTSFMDVNSWAAIRILALLGGLAGGIYAATQFEGIERLGVLALVVVIGFFGPEAVLTRAIDDRRSAVERDLPDIIDLLVISVEAGLGLEAALGRVVQVVPGDLSDEFARMLQETRVGVSRHEAMRNLADRTDVDDLDSFILAMNQADTFGVSVGRMLRVQAEEIRVRRRQRAQERAFGAPVKMVFPLVLCIFPSLFVVLLGPAMIDIADQLL